MEEKTSCRVTAFVKLINSINCKCSQLPVIKEFLLFVAANSLGCSSAKLERKERKRSSQISHYSLYCTVPLSVTSIYLPEGDNLFFLLTLPYLLHYTINKASGLCFTVQADEKEIRLLIFFVQFFKGQMYD